jgi:hypothetical protein
MKLQLLLFLACVLCSCAENSPEAPLKNKEQAKTDSADIFVIAKADTISEVKSLDTVLKSETNYFGALVRGVEWKDKRGMNRLIISETDDDYNWQKEAPWMKKVADSQHPESEKLVDIFAYHYIFDSEKNKWRAYWTLHDYKFSCCDVYIDYQPGSLIIEDIDHDGKAESSFAYIFPAFNDRRYPTKLILHADSNKIKAEGITGIEKDMYGENPKDEFSGKLLRNFIYLNWTKQRWKDCLARQFSLDSAERIRSQAEYERQQKEVQEYEKKQKKKKSS